MVDVGAVASARRLSSYELRPTADEGVAGGTLVGIAAGNRRRTMRA